MNNKTSKHCKESPLFFHFNRAVQRNPGTFHGMVLMGPLIKLVEEVTTPQFIAARVANFVVPKYEAVSFPLVSL